jgi:hypothetical protein
MGQLRRLASGRHSGARKTGPDWLRQKVPLCGVGIGNRCVTASGNDARAHESRRQQYRIEAKERALNTKQIRKEQERVARRRHFETALKAARATKAGA